MKKTLAVLLVLSLCFSLFACSNANSQDTVVDESYWDDAPTMKIAILTALTGASKETGDRAKRSVDYAVEQINANGGVLGKQLEVIYFDIGADQQSFINALQSAVNTEGISATIGYSTSTYTVAGSDIIRESQIPNITMGNSAGIFDLDNPYIWQARVPDKIGTEVLAKISFETYNVKNPAVVWMTDASGQSQHDAYVAAMESYGATIAADIGFDRTTTSDFNPIITQVMDSGSDGLALFCTNQQDGVLLAETVKQFDYPHPIGSSSGNFVYSFLDVLTDSAADGWYGVSEFNLDADIPIVKEYLAAMEERDTQGLGRPGWSEAAYYDSVYILTEAAKIANSTNPQKINEAMTQIKDIQGVMSSYSYHEDHSLANYLWVAEIDGNDIIIKEQVYRD